MITKNRRTNQNGFVLVSCMMIMVILTIIGMMAVSTTEIELLVAGNDKVAKSAFFRADSGIFTAPKVIREAITVGSGMEITTINDIDGIPPGDSQEPFYDKIMGFDNAAGYISFSQGKNTIDPNDRLVSTDILRSDEVPLEGDDAEFASGYGGGSSATFAILYTLNSTGTAPGDAQSRITAVYKFIPGRPGGL